MLREEFGDGIICAIGNGRALVAPLSDNDSGNGGRSNAESAKRKAGCGAGGCGSCGGCLRADTVPGGYIGRFYVNVDAAAYHPGDRVRFRRFVLNPNLASALIFGVPIAFALAAVLFWLANAPDQIESALAVFTVLAAFAIGIFIVGVIDRFFKTKFPAAVIGAGYDAGCGSRVSGSDDDDAGNTGENG